MPTTVETATKIASGLLEQSGIALLEGDFDRFAPLFAMPQSIATSDGARWLETRDDLHDVFRMVRSHYRDIGVARLDRRVEAALFDGNGRIHYSHITRFLRADGSLVKPPFNNLSRAVKGEAGWQVSGTQYAITEDPRHSRALLSSGSTVDAARQIELLGQPAEAIFQENLDAVTRAFLTCDADLLLERMQLPVFMQKSTGSMLFATPEDLVQDLKRYDTEFRVHGVTDLVRTVKSVEMVGERRMHGTYRTHVLRGKDLLIPSYLSAMTLEQGEDLEWRTTSVMHPMGRLTVRRVLFGEEE